MKKKIFIIDDDINHLITTKAILESEGYEVIIHQNGFGAINSVRDAEPDLILLDINMPGLSGENLCTLLMDYNKTKDIPIVFYSSNDEDCLRKTVKEKKARGYICKGDLAGLRKKISEYLK